ncbi:TetR family transcriptional regulator C-terminal domain-containing protein [Actinomadura meridiana]|uniref:TetR family transcriptional regulator C-terminal domain-containing protein n=1 Tax=Actinomadura meridiana TaxID=559626 RepID=UPI0031E5E0D7
MCEYARFHRQIADLIRRDRDAGLITTADPERAAVDLVAHAEGLAYYVLIGVVGVEAARVRVLAAVATLY